MPETNGQAGAPKIAVIHRAGGTLRCVAGIAGGRGLSAWAELPAGKPDKLAAWLAEQGVGAVINVLPAARVVCRTCLLPNADAAHLAQALTLQAEAHMPVEIPAHRQARAVLPIAQGETSRSGVLVWWPPGASERELCGADPATWSGPISYVPDVAALAALLNGRRPDGALVWFDRDDGSVALAVIQSNGAVFRAARVGGGRQAADISRVVAETALSVGHGADFTQSLVATVQRGVEAVDRVAGLVAPDEVIEQAAVRLPGAPGDPRWWRDYAVAAGALLAATGELAPLTRMQLDAPVERPSRLRHILDVLSTPRGAARAVAVGVAVALFSPLLFAGLRLAVLEMRLPDLKKALNEARESEAALAVYGEMRSNDWPMTKLVADIACNTPESIEIELIRIRHNEPVTISGRAKPDDKSQRSAQEVVTQMQDNLRKSGLFQEIHLNWGDPNNFGAYEFNLTAKVNNPFRPHEYPRELDYGAWTLRDRLYPQAAAATPAPAPDKPAVELVHDDHAAAPDEHAEAPEAGSPPEDVAQVDPAEGHTRQRSTADPAGPMGPDDGVASRGGPDRATGGTPMSQQIPDPLSPEQINAMGLAEAQEAYGRFSQAIQQGRLDQGTRQRLWQDWKLLRERVRELKSKEDKGGAP